MTHFDEMYDAVPVDPFNEHGGSGFCYNMTCSCHEDTGNIATLNQAVQDGLVTVAEAEHIYRGRTV